VTGDALIGGALTAGTGQTDTDFTVGVLANDVLPVFSIVGDAENDNATPVNETYSAVLVQNANPNLAYLQWSTTQSTVGMDFNMPVRATSFVADGVLSGTTITASTGFALGDDDYVGITSNEYFEFDAGGNIYVEGAHFQINKTATEGETPHFYIAVDSDADGGDLVAEIFRLQITADATPGDAVWHFNSSNGLTMAFDAALTAAGLGLGANDLTMTGSIGVTGSRVAKLWATAVEVTSATGLTINGGQIDYDDLASGAQVGMLNENETLIGHWSYPLTACALTDGIPTDTEIDTGTGTTPGAVPAGYTEYLEDNSDGVIYQVISDGVDSWYYFTGTLAINP